MKFWNNHKSAILAFSITLMLMSIFYSDLFLSPNSYVFASGGDGLRNYYSCIYHAKHDTTFWEFSGMNYPYSEVIVYTDAHPLLSYLIGALGLANYTVGILNLTMLFSIPLCAFFIAKIFSHFNVNLYWAFSGAVTIALLSPQVQRLTGHTSLSYSFAIPMLWWCLIKYKTSSKLKWSLVIASLITVFFFMHPYLGLIMVAFLAAFLFVTLILEKKDRLKNVSYFLFQAILPLLLFRILLAINDTHAGRTGIPTGLFHYYASWKSFFIPNYGPFNFVKDVFDINIGNWESWNYIGFSTLIFLIVIIIYAFRNIKNLSFQEVFNSQLTKYIYAASLILMIAFCFPLKYWWAIWVTDYIGALKQFRVLGRFGWVFFYVLTTSTIIVLFRIYTRSSKKILLSTLYFSGVLFMLIEAYPIHKMISTEAKATPNHFQKKALNPQVNEIIEFIDEGEYNALMVLPFTHLSSENILLDGGESGKKLAFILSYHTGIPLMNSLSGRMSISEAKIFNNFFGPPFIYKALANDIPENDKVLIVTGNEDLPEREKRLLSAQIKAFQNKDYTAYILDLEQYNNRLDYDEIINKQANDTLSYKYHHNSYNSKTDYAFSGNNAFKGVKNGWFVMDTIDNKELPHGNYTASIWYYLGVNRPDMLFNCELLYRDSKVLVDKFDIKQSTHIVNDWCLAEIHFEFPEDCNEFRLCITGNDKREPFYVDDLMVYPDTAHIFGTQVIQGKNYTVYNNYRLPEWGN